MLSRTWHQSITVFVLVFLSPFLFVSSARLRTYAGRVYETLIPMVDANNPQAPFLDDIRDVGTYDVAVLGVPFDGGTTYRPGTRFGPQGIRRISALCEF